MPEKITLELNQLLGLAAIVISMPVLGKPVINFVKHAFRGVHMRRRILGKLLLGCLGLLGVNEIFIEGRDFECNAKSCVAAKSDPHTKTSYFLKTVPKESAPILCSQCKIEQNPNHSPACVFLAGFDKWVLGIGTILAFLATICYVPDEYDKWLEEKNEKIKQVNG